MSFFAIRLPRFIVDSVIGANLWLQHGSVIGRGCAICLPKNDAPRSQLIQNGRSDSTASRSVMQLTNFTATPGVKVGWVEQPNQRGTYNIIWSCLLLLISSTWTVLHINVPADHETYRDIVSRKARWTVFYLLTSEMVTILSGLQWKSARDSMQLIHDLNAGV